MSSLSPRYQVRPATVRDAKAIAEIHVAAWQAAYDGVLPADHLEQLSVAKRQAYWREAIENYEPQVLVVTDDGQVVGFVGFDRSRDAGTPSTMGELWAFYVTPGCWSTGAGLALWDAARDGLEEEGCTHVSIWTHVCNTRALHFLERAGFRREPATAKTVEIGGVALEEIRLQRAVA
jgi:ribosomal protein S18 acetylase RimI-like enzyme